MMVEQLLIAGITSSVDDRGRLHLWGEVFNLGTQTQRWVRITARLHAADDTPLVEQTDILALEWTLPAAHNPFYLRFPTPPRGWHHYDFAVTPQPHDYDDPNLPQPHINLMVDRLHYREIGRADLQCGIIGLLTNTGAQAATHVKLAGTLYDSQGDVVGVLSPYLVGRNLLAPGDSLIFELKYYAVGGEVANYAVAAQGRIATGPS